MYSSPLGIILFILIFCNTMIVNGGAIFNKRTDAISNIKFQHLVDDLFQSIICNSSQQNNTKKCSRINVKEMQKYEPMLKKTEIKAYFDFENDLSKRTELAQCLIISTTPTKTFSKIAVDKTIDNFIQILSGDKDFVDYKMFKNHCDELMKKGVDFGCINKLIHK